MKTNISPLVLAASLLVGLSATASAQTIWTGGAANDNFNDAANWSNGVPTNGGAGSRITFNGTTRLTPSNDLVNYGIERIFFDPGAGSFNISGNRFFQTGDIINTSGADQTFSVAKINIGGSRVVTAADGSIIFNTFYEGGHGMTFNAGSRVLGNQITLAGGNIYTGATTVNSGTLRLNYGASDTSKLADAALTMNGATLEMVGGSHSQVVASNVWNVSQNRIVRTGGSSTLTVTTFTAPGSALDISEGGFVSSGNTLSLSSGIISTRLTIGGADWAVQNGSNQFVAYTGYTALPTSGGSTSVQYDITSSTTAVGNLATANLKIAPGSAGQSLDLAGFNLNTSGGGLLFTGAHDFEINTGAGNVNTRIWQVWGTGDLTVNGTIAPAANNAIDKYGIGKLVIDGNVTTTSTTPLVINAGSVQVNSNAAIGTESTGGAVSLRGGTLIADTSGGSFGLYNGTAGTNNRNIVLHQNGGGLNVIGGNTLTIAGVISTQAGVAVSPLVVGSATSNGRVELTGANEYSGGTYVNGGTLLLNNSSGSATGTGSVNVSSGGTLGGAGSMSGALFASGSIAPGNSIGTLNVGTTTWNSGDNWVFELGAGNTSDMLNITGDFLRGSGSSFVFDFAGGTDLGTFTLVQWTGTTSFSFPTDFSITNLGGGNTGEFAFSGNQLQLTVIPEPSTWALLIGSLVLLIVIRRRRIRF